MTCLVAIKYEDYDKKGLLFAADSLVSSYKKHTESSAVTNKIMKKDDLVIACCGSLRTADIIKYQFKPNLKCFSKNYKEEFKEYIGGVLIPDLISLFRENNILEEKENITKENCYFDLLLGFDNEIYSISHDFSLRHIQSYTAKGSGACYALGAIHNSLEILKESGFEDLMLKEQAVTISTRAINAAAHFDFYVDNNITFEFLEENKLNEEVNKNEK